MITKEMVAAAVEKNGFPLVASDWGGFFTGDKPTCGCAFTHLYASEHNLMDVTVRNENNTYKMINGMKIYRWAQEKFGEAYTFHFLRGFDYLTFTFCGSLDENYKIASKAYEDGRACRELL